MNILANLPPGFFSHSDLAPCFDRLRALGEVRTASHNTADEIRTDVSWCDAILMWSWPSLDAALLDGAPSLRFRGHIDIRQADARLALERGVPISVSRHGFSPAVSEMALALILNLLRRVSDYHAAMRAGSEAWVRDFPTEIDPRERELSGRPVGIIGLGRVGRGLASLLRPFGGELRVFDPFVPEQVLAEFGARRVELSELLRGSDVVVLCAASNTGSRHLLGAEEIEMLRASAILVNVARAALVDTAALVERLKRGDLFAALDVFDREPLDSGSELRALPNAYLSPHRAGGTLSSARRILDYLIDDLEAVLDGRPQRCALVEAMVPSLDAW